MIKVPVSFEKQPAQSGPAASGERILLNAAALGVAVMLAVVYSRAFAAAWPLWTTDDSNAHCLLIPVIAAVLCWLQRRRIAAAERAPQWQGVVWLAGGLVVEIASFHARIRWFPLLSLVPVMAGAILALHGTNLWRVVRFPVLFLVFLSPAPQSIVNPIAVRVQQLSTSGAVAALSAVGLPVVQNGFFIDTPSLSVEVTRGCSGFNKLESLGAFAVLYGYLYALSMVKRIALVLSILPVALAANMLRIFLLVVIGSNWGVHALHLAHDSAEIVVVIVAFVSLSAIGRGLGCKSIRADLTGS